MSRRALLIIPAITIIICASPVRAANCKELRSQRVFIDKKIEFVNKMINQDSFGSEQVDRDLELGKRTVREYIDVANIFLSMKCPDNGRVASSVHIFTMMLDGMR